MADKSDRSTLFPVLAAILALLIGIAAAVLFTQPGTRSPGDQALPALAALSQAMPRHGAAAMAGDDAAFGLLETDLQRLKTNLDATGGSLTGTASWQMLDRQGRAVLQRRDAVAMVQQAAELVRDRMPALLTASDELLSRSGATDILQRFQRSGVEVTQSLADLNNSQISDTHSNPEQSIAHGRTAAAFMRQVLAGLAGQPSDLDLSALPDEDQERLVQPALSDLTEIEARLEQAATVAPQLAELRVAQASLADAAADLYKTGFTAKPAKSSLPWLPLTLLLLSLLTLGALYMLHGRALGERRTTARQADQNERNQQAILRLLDELGSLADGDLTAKATVSEDITGAIADSINYAIEKLRELVATINDTAIMVDSAAKQTENSAGRLEIATETQSREIAAATDSIASMAYSIEQVSGDAERSSDVARHSVEVAHKGGEAVRRTIDGMNTIRETIQDTSKRIKRLGESSQEIGNIVELINDIAEQTNILALNASIQASMAGEAGRGFAVVADEVQRLAERSTNATKQIEVLVRTIQADTNEAVVSMERSTTDVVGGALLAENAGAALDEIEQVSNQIANLVQNISASAREQAGAAEDVTQRTTVLKQISEDASNATAATAASISKLSELASQLRQTVAGFTLPDMATSGVFMRPDDSDVSDSREQAAS